MRVNRLLGTLIALACVYAPSVAEADTIEGDISVIMNIQPNCGNNSVNCTTLGALGTATGLDFIAISGSTATPGLAGAEFVTLGTEDFSGLTGQFGFIKDFSFAGAGTANFPTATILAWQTVGAMTFDLLSVTIDTQNSTQLALTGTGMFHLAGFEDTLGTFTITANASGRTFSASASQGAVPDGGSTAALLGSVLFAFGMLRRRFS